MKYVVLFRGINVGGRNKIPMPELREHLVGRSFGSKYVEFETANVKLALYGRRALAKDAGVPVEGTGSHRIAISSDAGRFTDLDGFSWE